MKNFYYLMSLLMFFCTIFAWNYISGNKTEDIWLLLPASAFLCGIIFWLISEIFVQQEENAKLKKQIRELISSQRITYHQQ